MRPPEFPDTWAEAADGAGFAFYELERPLPEARWAGGFGHSRRDGTNELEIRFLVAGREISVSTLNESPLCGRPEWVAWHLIDHLLSDSLSSEGPEIRLPMTWTAESSDRPIAVDSVEVSFTGIVLNGTWAGWAVLTSGVGLRVRAPVEQVPSALTRCIDWSMGDVPPVGRER